MESIILWGSIALIVVAVGLGFLGGFLRGLKRSSLHFLFVIASLVLAFFITKPITQAVLGITITADGTDYTISGYIVHIIETSFDLSNYPTATEFLGQVPTAIASPILFILIALLSYVVFEVLYLIIARLAFGKKKKDFEKNKPRKLYGGLIGLVEGFLFMFALFCPLTALTNTYKEITDLPPAEVQTADANDEGMKTIAQTIKDVIPESVHNAIIMFNDSAIGKISSLGGIDKAMFDGLSNFEFGGEKISFRTELLNLTDTYDSFVDVYNDFNNKNYADINLKDLRDNIEKFLDNGIFKAVVSQVAKEFVVNLDLVNDNMPQIVKDFVAELKPIFEDEAFDAYTYLKNDILKVVDTAIMVVEDKLIEEYENLQDTSLENILAFVDDNSESVKEIAKSIFDVNIISDAIKPILKLASTEFAKIVEDNKGLEIGLNSEITDTDKMVEDLVDTIDELLSINLNISDLMKEDADILTIISNIEDDPLTPENEGLGETLKQTGKVFDKFRNLEIFVLPKGDGLADDVYVFDNLLKIYDLDLLKDTKADGSKKFEKYEDFFNYIKEPIEKADKIGLLEFSDPNFNFDSVIDGLLEELKTDTTYLTDIMLPFKDITALKLNELVFDKVKTELSTKVDILDFTNVGDDEWETQLNLLGTTLNALNQGEIIENEGMADETRKTYIKYLLDEGDMEVLLDTVVADKKLKDVLDPMITSKIFDKVIKEIFSTIDSKVGEETGVAPTTVLTNLKSRKDGVIEDLEALVEIINESEDLTFKQLGKILDALKFNAYNDTTENAVNDGAKDGVFNNIFANLIWYLTGDVLNGVNYGTAQPNPFATQIKDALQNEGVSGDEYYVVPSWETTLENIDKALNPGA